MDYFNTLYSDDDDTSLYDKTTKESFFIHLKDYGFDFSNVDSETRLPNSMTAVISNDVDAFNKFNLALAKLHKEKIVNILDAVSFLVADYLEPPVALKCLDEINFIALKNELMKKFTVEQNKQVGEVSLLDFL